MENKYAKLLPALLICSWTPFSLTAELQIKDDYQVYIEKMQGIPNFWYTFCKTNITGGTVYPEQNGNKIEELTESRKEIDTNIFTALKRSDNLSDRASRYTRLLISIDKKALEAKLANQADSSQKESIVSQKIPQKIGDFCHETLTFKVSKKNDKLSIKVEDKRICMRSGSDKARKLKEEAKLQERFKRSHERQAGWQAAEKEKRQKDADERGRQQERADEEREAKKRRQEESRRAALTPEERAREDDTRRLKQLKKRVGPKDLEEINQLELKLQK